MKHDTDNSGSIQINEFREIYREINEWIVDGDWLSLMQALFNSLDEDHSGKMEYGEFVNAMKRLQYDAMAVYESVDSTCPSKCICRFSRILTLFITISSIWTASSRLFRFCRCWRWSLQCATRRTADVLMSISTTFWILSSLFPFNVYIVCWSKGSHSIHRLFDWVYVSYFYPCFYLTISTHSHPCFLLPLFLHNLLRPPLSSKQTTKLNDPIQNSANPSIHTHTPRHAR